MEASRESLASTDGPTVQVARLTWLPLRRFADFSYVRRLFSPDNFHSCGWLVPGRPHPIIEPFDAVHVVMFPSGVAPRD